MGCQLGVREGVGVIAISPRLTALLPWCSMRLHRLRSGGATGSNVSVIIIVDLVFDGLWARKNTAREWEVLVEMVGVNLLKLVGFSSY